MKPATNDAETPHITVPAPSIEHSADVNPNGIKMVLRHAPKEMKDPSTNVKMTKSIIKFLSHKACESVEQKCFSSGSLVATIEGGRSGLVLINRMNGIESTVMNMF